MNYSTLWNNFLYTSPLKMLFLVKTRRGGGIVLSVDKIFFPLFVYFYFSSNIFSKLGMGGWWWKLVCVYVDDCSLDLGSMDMLSHRQLSAPSACTNKKTSDEETNSFRK